MDKSYLCDFSMRPKSCQVQEKTDESLNLPSDFAYLPGVLSPNRAQCYLEALLIETVWQQRQTNFFGRKPMPRLMMYFGPVDYNYGRHHWPSHPLPPRLEIIRDQVEAAAGWPFNAVLINLYRNGGDHISFHSDSIDGHGAQPTIAVLSLGAPRKIHLRRKIGSKKLISLVLEPGSVFLMKGSAQQNWLHKIPKTSRPIGPRISLTFRWMMDPAASPPPIRLGGERDAHLFPEDFGAELAKAS